MNKEKKTIWIIWSTIVFVVIVLIVAKLDKPKVTPVLDEQIIENNYTWVKDNGIMDLTYLQVRHISLRIPYCEYRNVNITKVVRQFECAVDCKDLKLCKYEIKTCQEDVPLSSVYYEYETIRSKVKFEIFVYYDFEHTVEWCS